MNHDNKQQTDNRVQDGHLTKDVNNKSEEERGSGVWKYVKVSVMVFVLLIGITRYVLPSFSVSGFFGNNRTQVALDYYLDQYGYEGDPKDVQSRLRRFGCHEEIHIYINGELVQKLTYSNGQVFEIQ